MADSGMQALPQDLLAALSGTPWLSEVQLETRAEGWSLRWAWTSPFFLMTLPISGVFLPTQHWA